MKILSHQTTPALEKFRDRIIEDGIFDYTVNSTLWKINYILECRKQNRPVLPCQGACWWECGEACINK